MKRDTFIEKATIRHSNKYDYSLVVDTINIKEKYTIICAVHGEFQQRGDAHLSGQGCGKCGNSVLSDINEFIVKANILHNNKYDYSEAIYINCKEKINIICPVHGIFFQSPDNHLAGHGCTKCSNVINSKKLINFNIDKFKIKANKIHDNKFNYTNVTYINARTKIIIICPKHGEFYQKVNDHLKGRGCPICNQSRGEIEIIKYLKKNNIRYIPQKKFDGCINEQKLPFDFYLPDYNVCVEYDGIQHFEPIEYFGGIKYLELLQKCDKIKTQYCQDNNIGLIRIKYDENIETKLNEYLKLN